MKISVLQAQGRVPVTILRLVGSLDGATYEDLINTGIEAHDKGTRDVLLDMRGLDFMSSAGMVALQMLLRLLGGEATPRGPGADFRAAAATGGGAGGLGHLRLLAPPPDIRRVLEVVGLIDYFPVYEDESEAVASF